MKKYREWTAFRPYENRIYDRQKRIAQYKLFSAEDALDLYSNHAQRHVAEVMEQCIALFRALAEWIGDMLPGEVEEDLIRNLIVAAKLHDIAMSPSDEMLRMLQIIDEMYAAAISDDIHAVQLSEKCRELERIAQNKPFPDARGLRVIRALCCDPDRTTRKKLAQMLAEAHDGVKDGIRKNHARLGAKFVLQNRETIEENYGKEIDLHLIAVLVGLHSLSSSSCTHIGFSDRASSGGTEKYIRELLGADAAEKDERWIRKAVVLASILRLADTRRSGERLTTIEDAKLFYEKNGDREELFIDRGYGAQRVMERIAHDILLAECCTRFEDVTVRREGAVWTAEHRIRVIDWTHEEIWRVFLSQRLKSYMEEIQTSVFIHALRNEIVVCLSGEDMSEEQSAMLEEVRKGDTRIAIKVAK